jgi:hypothetical protein
LNAFAEEIIMRKTSWQAQVAILSFVALLGGAGPASPDPLEYSKRPLVFEENRPGARYLARGEGYGVFLSPGEATLALRGPERRVRALSLRWTGAGASRAAAMAAEGLLPAKAHSFRGNDPKGWLHSPLFSRVRYRGVYPGIDLVFYGRQRQLEYDFVLAPGADPDAIRLGLEGAERLEIDPAGDLVLALGDGEVRFRRPVSYQEVDGVRREVESRFRLLPERGQGREVGFEVGAYDRSRTLVIDPVLVYSTYLGGHDEEGSRSVALDAAGNVYVAGYTVTNEPPNDFPVTPGAFQTAGSWYDPFIAKFDRSGALVYSTLLGGESDDGLGGIEVDRTGNVYVTGHTDSPDFPLVSSLQPAPRDYVPDAFVAKLSADGSELLFSTTLGGSDGDWGTDIGMDARGALYVTGWTDSADFPQPGFPPLPPGHRTSSSDVFVVKLAPGGAGLVYSRVVGGEHVEFGERIAVDEAGRVHVTGFTGSARFPVVNSAQPAWGGDYDAFALKLDSAGSVVYSTYLGGSGTDTGHGIALDAAGNAYVTGETLSDGFPVRSALQPVRRGSRDNFVAKLSPAGALVYSTYLGGVHDDQALAIAADRAGSVYVTGVTSSSDYPLVDPLQAGCAPNNPPDVRFRRPDAFVTRISASGSAILFSTCLGGSEGDGGQAIALHPSGDVVVTGVTGSPDFPVTRPVFGDGGGVFVTRIRLRRGEAGPR